MNTPIKVRILSKIEDSNGEVSEITIFTEATYRTVGTKAYLMYEESGIEGTKTLLSYDNQVLNIKRYGQVNSDLGIHLGKTRENHYRTQYGIFIMHTRGKTIRWKTTPGLHIELDYTLCMEGEETCSNVLIEIEEIDT